MLNKLVSECMVEVSNLAARLREVYRLLSPPDGQSQDVATLYRIRGVLNRVSVTLILMESVEQENARLRKVLEPFARMYRPCTDRNELACRRGVASDMTIITSGDFEDAHRALEGTE